MVIHDQYLSSKYLNCDYLQSEDNIPKNTFDSSPYGPELTSTLSQPDFWNFHAEEKLSKSFAIKIIGDSDESHSTLRNDSFLNELQNDPFHTIREHSLISNDFRKNDLNFNMGNKAEINPYWESNKKNKIITVNYQLKNTAKSGRPDQNYEEIIENKNSVEQLDMKMNPEKILLDSEQNPFSITGNEGNFQKIESSFITKEFKTSTSFKDFINSPHTKDPNQHTFGCNLDCKGNKSNYSQIPTKNEQNTNMYYMESELFKSSNQGIPCRNQRTRFLPFERKMLSVQSNTYIPCSSGKTFIPEELAVMNTDRLFYCGRVPVQTNFNTDDYACCSCKPPIQQSTSKKSKPKPKKKRHITCCKSANVDKDELFAEKKDQDPIKVQQRDVNVHSNIGCNLNSPERQQIFSDSQAKYHRYCPYVHYPEKEYQIGCLNPQPIMKSVGCECEKNETKMSANTTDVNRNITIQILPTCCRQNECSKHKNLPPLTKCINENMYTCNACCEDASFKNEMDYFDCQPCSGDMKFFERYKEHCHQAHHLKEKSAFRWWNRNWKSKKRRALNRRIPRLVKTNDCCTTTNQIYHEDDFQLSAISNCQRVLPINTVYTNKDYYILKSLQRNKGLLGELFATPCPSSSSACSSRKKENPMCAKTFYYAPKSTTNQCCQYELNCKESEKTDSNKNIFCECLSYLKKMCENYSGYIEEDYCCCCQTCCCCRRELYTPCKDVISPQVEEKKSKSCRCRCVEAKQSLRHCGTIVSNHCFKSFETVSTNTEFRPKAPKLEVKKRHFCCKRRCRCCCCPPRNFCCGGCEATTCCKTMQNISKDQCSVCCYHFETQPRLKGSFIQCETSRSALGMKIELLKSRMKETLNVKISECSTINQITKEALMKNFLMNSLILDLCNFSEKEFPIFGAPFKEYYWNQNSFFLNMPLEIDGFIETKKTDYLSESNSFDPTPCLTPEVLDQ